VSGIRWHSNFKVCHYCVWSWWNVTFNLKQINFNLLCIHENIHIISHSFLNVYNAKIESVKLNSKICFDICCKCACVKACIHFCFTFLVCKLARTITDFSYNKLKGNATLTNHISGFHSVLWKRNFYVLFE